MPDRNSLKLPLTIRIFDRPPPPAAPSLTQWATANSSFTQGPHEQSPGPHIPKQIPTKLPRTPTREKKHRRTCPGYSQLLPLSTGPLRSCQEISQSQLRATQTISQPPAPTGTPPGPRADPSPCPHLSLGPQQRLQETQAPLPMLGWPTLMNFEKTPNPQIPLDNIFPPQ